MSASVMVTQVLPRSSASKGRPIGHAIVEGADLEGEMATFPAVFHVVFGDCVSVIANGAALTKRGRPGFVSRGGAYGSLAKMRAERGLVLEVEAELGVGDGRVAAEGDTVVEQRAFLRGSRGRWRWQKRCCRG